MMRLFAADNGKIIYRLLAITVIFAPVINATASDDEPAPQRRIALSFDDAPKGDGPIFTGDERGERLLEVLKSAGVGQVVFFVTTGNFARPGGKERVVSYAEAGHLIANHSHSHSWLSRTETDAYISDIDRAEDLLRGFNNRRAWFRFPYLDEGKTAEKRDAVRAALATRGLRNGFVTVDNYDWYLDRKWKEAVDEGRVVDIEVLRDIYMNMLLGAVKFYDDIALEALGESSVQMLLLHENDIAALFVGDLVAGLRERGWAIVSPDEVYSSSIARIEAKTLKTGQGQVAALAIDAGLDPRTLSHFALDEAQIDAMLLKREVFSEP